MPKKKADFFKLWLECKYCTLPTTPLIEMSENVPVELIIETVTASMAECDDETGATNEEEEAIDEMMMFNEFKMVQVFKNQGSRVSV